MTRRWRLAVFPLVPPVAVPAFLLPMAGPAAVSPPAGQGRVQVTVHPTVDRAGLVSAGQERRACGPASTASDSRVWRQTPR